jgi:hypothetical protein
MRTLSAQRTAATVAALLLAGIATSATAAAGAHSTSTAKPRGRNCSLLSLTLVLDFLVAAKKTPNLASARERGAWNGMLRQADQAQEDFQAPTSALARRYGVLHAKLKAADVALRNHDSAAYSHAVDALKPALNAVTTLAKRARLTCTIHSKGGTLTLGP